MNPKQKYPDVICIDFDRTIHDVKNVPPGHKMGYPIPGAVEAVNQIYNNGFQVVILTARSRASHRIVAQWLVHFGIPFNQVTNVKPEAKVYIDDRGYRFQGDWDKVLSIIPIIDSNPEAKL